MAHLQSSTYSGAAGGDSSIFSSKESKERAERRKVSRTPQAAQDLWQCQRLFLYTAAPTGSATVDRYGEKVYPESFLPKLLEGLYRIERQIWAQF